MDAPFGSAGVVWVYRSPTIHHSTECGVSGARNTVWGGGQQPTAVCGAALRPAPTSSRCTGASPPCPLQPPCGPSRPAWRAGPGRHREGSLVSVAGGSVPPELPKAGMSHQPGPHRHGNPSLTPCSECSEGAESPEKAIFGPFSGPHPGRHYPLGLGGGSGVLGRHPRALRGGVGQIPPAGATLQVRVHRKNAPLLSDAPPPALG